MTDGRRREIPALGALAEDGRLSRRALLLTDGARGALAVMPRPLRLLHADAEAAGDGFAQSALATYVVAGGAICSFDGQSPPLVTEGG